jgi:Flp pilus assembly protein TadB
MAIDLQRPRAIHVVLGETLGAHRAERRSGEPIGRALVRAISRSFGVGTIIGVLLVAGAHPTVASVALVGIVALVLALLTFERDAGLDP